MLNTYKYKLVALLLFLSRAISTYSAEPETPDPTTFKGKVLVGYQGWFRTPTDGENLGWVHWSRDSKKIEPATLTFEMWPDMTEYSPEERYPATGFTYPDGKPAELFSAANERTVLRHFEWMRDYGIDGAFLQHFVVDLKGGPISKRYESRMKTLNFVRAACNKTGRVWALTYDLSGVANDKIFEIVCADWKKLVDDKVAADPRYLHQDGKPVVQIFGFHKNTKPNELTPETANKLIDFFKTPGPYAAFLVGAGDWNWRREADEDWHKIFRRFDSFEPWNIGNYALNPAKEKIASRGYWAADKKECDANKMVWLPTVYPGFSWDNLTRKEPGTTGFARRGGKFYWEQFVELAKMKVNTVFIAMFDEVDEGTAIFKVTSSPPKEAHFVGLEGLPSDHYLWLTQESIKMLRGKREVSAELPTR